MNPILSSGYKFKATVCQSLFLARFSSIIWCDRRYKWSVLQIRFLWRKVWKTWGCNSGRRVAKINSQHQFCKSACSFLLLKGIWMRNAQWKQNRGFEHLYFSCAFLIKLRSGNGGTVFCKGACARKAACLECSWSLFEIKQICFQNPVDWTKEETDFPYCCLALDILFGCGWKLYCWLWICIALQLYGLGWSGAV